MPDDVRASAMAVTGKFPRKVLVSGATGYVGGQLVPRLLTAGYDVRCLTRDPGRLAGRPQPWPRAELVQGDVLDPTSLERVMQGIDVAYYLVHSMAGDGRDFSERDRQAAANFARAAAAHGVGRIIYLGGLGMDDATLSAHLRSRHEVGEILRSGSVPVTEFRAAIVVGAGSVSFELIRYLTERLPVMTTPRWVQTPCQPIGIGDLLAYLIAALAEPRSAGRVIEIGGSTVLSYGDMMRGYAKVRGLRRLIVPVPVLTPALSSYWIGLVTPVPHTIGRLLIDGLRNPVVVRSRSGTGPVSADCAAELCGGGAVGSRAAGVGRCRDDVDHGAWRSARGGAATGTSPRGRGPGDGAARTVGERLAGRSLPHLQWHRGTERLVLRRLVVAIAWAARPDRRRGRSAARDGATTTSCCRAKRWTGGGWRKSSRAG